MATTLGKKIVIKCPFSISQFSDNGVYKDHQIFILESSHRIQSNVRRSLLMTFSCNRAPIPCHRGFHSLPVLCDPYTRYTIFVFVFSPVLFLKQEFEVIKLE